MCGVQAGARCAWTMSKAGICFRISKPTSSLPFPRQGFPLLLLPGSQGQTLPQPVWISEDRKSHVPSCLTLVSPVTWDLYSSPVSPERLLSWWDCSVVSMVFFKGLLILFVLVWCFFFLKWEGMNPNTMFIPVPFCIWVLIKSPCHNVSWRAVWYTLLLDQFPASAGICPVNAIALRYNFLLSPLPGYLPLMQWSLWDTAVLGMP